LSTSGIEFECCNLYSVSVRSGSVTTASGAGTWTTRCRPARSMPVRG